MQNETQQNKDVNITVPSKAPEPAFGNYSFGKVIQQNNSKNETDLAKLKTT